VGSGIAKALLNAGAKVWISSRDEKRLRDFKESLPENLKSKLDYVKGEVSSEADCIRIRDHILKEDKKINHVVSSLG
jgi:short-subunit dehydrogenase